MPRSNSFGRPQDRFVVGAHPKMNLKGLHASTNLLVYLEVSVQCKIAGKLHAMFECALKETIKPEIRCKTREWYRIGFVRKASRICIVAIMSARLRENHIGWQCHVQIGVPSAC